MPKTALETVQLIPAIENCVIVGCVKSSDGKDLSLLHNFYGSNNSVGLYKACCITQNDL